MTECIHGLDIELCDICNPRIREEQAKPAPVKATRIPKASPRKAQAPRLRDSGPATSAATGPDLASLRAHHWTHSSNLPAILAAGALQAGASPTLDVSSPDARAAREAAIMPGGATVASHVPLALSPLATSWNEVRTGAEGDRWSAAARAGRATDYVMLVFPVAALGGEIVVTDGEASGEGVRAADGLTEGGSLVRRASLSDPDLLGVELLVANEVPLSALTLIGVANDKARDLVKGMIDEAGGLKPRVAIYPPWFRPNED